MSFVDRTVKIALLATVSALVITGCNSTSAENEILTSITDQVQFSYETAEAKYMTIEELEKIPASLGFAETEYYKAPYDSKVKEYNLLKNKLVKKGDVLIALDTTDIDFEINELELKISGMSNSIERGYAEIELDKLKEKRNAAVVTAPYDGVISECAILTVGSDVKEGTALCAVSVTDSIFVYNSQGGGSNLRFGMDVDLVINSVDYVGTVTAAPDNAPSTASQATLKYCAVSLPDDEIKRLLEENNGIAAVDAGWATIHAITNRRVNVLAVPEEAIKTDGNKTYCSILQGEEKYEMPVEVGAYAGGYAEIISGLNEGDVVIIAESTGNGENTNNNNNNNNINDNGNEFANGDFNFGNGNLKLGADNS